jgi:N-acetylmuramoyl-L-alanine amidase
MIELRAVASHPLSANPPAAPQGQLEPVAAVLLERPVAVEKPSTEPKAVPVAVAAVAKPAPAEPVLPPALAAQRTTSGDRTLIRALGLKVARVVIDPGHGGHDHGSSGRNGLMEKELVLDVAQRLGALIEERMGSEVIYTRADDTFIPLESRTALANEKSADLFLSIHANSSPYPSVSGVETYYLNFSSSRDEMDIAARENAGSQKTVHELGDIIQKITKHDKAEESREFAGKMQTALYSAATKSNPAAKNRGVKKAPFVVLIGATMPSILAEIGFVSNSREEGLLKRPDHRQKLAEALYRGLSRYAETLSHFELAAKQ